MTTAPELEGFALHLLKTAQPEGEILRVRSIVILDKDKISGIFDGRLMGHFRKSSISRSVSSYEFLIMKDTLTIFHMEFEQNDDFNNVEFMPVYNLKSVANLLDQFWQTKFLTPSNVEDMCRGHLVNGPQRLYFSSALDLLNYRIQIKKNKIEGAFIEWKHPVNGDTHFLNIDINGKITGDIPKEFCSQSMDMHMELF